MNQLFSFIGDILFPKHCFGCSKLGVYICLSCREKLKTVDFDRCPYCQKSSYFGLTHPSCKKNWCLDGIKSLLRYDNLTRRVIRQIKYQLVRDAIGEFWQSISTVKKEELLFYKKLGRNFILLPVPLHKKRFQERGFNQSFELAEFFSVMLGFPIVDDLIIRIKNTKPQVEFTTPNERYRNIVGAFILNKEIDQDKIAGKKFIIIDDVWTTGSTVKEIAKILKKHGASKVLALTIAR